MKHLLYIIILLFIIAIATADVNVYKVRAKLNGELLPDVDKDGGTIDVYPDDELNFEIKVDNDQDNESEFGIIGIIEEIDDEEDMVDRVRNFTLGSGMQSDYKSLDYAIPYDVSKGTYIFYLTVNQRDKNGSNYSAWTILFEQDYNIKVISEAETKEEMTTTNILTNMSSVCNNVISTVNGCFSYINKSLEYYDLYSTCQEKRGQFESEKNVCYANIDNIEKEKNQCHADKDTINNKLVEAENKMAQMIMIYDCNNQTFYRINSEVAKAKSQLWQNFVMIGIVGVLIFGVWRYKQRTETQASKFKYSFHGHR